MFSFTKFLIALIAFLLISIANIETMGDKKFLKGLIFGILFAKNNGMVVGMGQQQQPIYQPIPYQ
jgi:hypothetical protein